MIRPLSIVVLLLAGCVCSFSEQPPLIGAKFKRKWKESKELRPCMTASAQIDPCVERVLDGIMYEIAYREETHRVTYVFTSDKKFSTVDGLKVGDSVPVSKETARGEPGWQIYATTTRDGWRPVVGYDGLRIKLADGTVLDLTASEGLKSGLALILGFSKTNR